MTIQYPVLRHRESRVRRLAPAVLLLLLFASPASAQISQVQVASDDSGMWLEVDGGKFMVLGMNWDYFPIGENYNYNLWSQSEEIIRAALGREMPLLKSMGINAIRLYAGIPPRWVQYIYETWGIFTVLNHPMGRYGFTLDGVFQDPVDYSDPRMRDAIQAEILTLVEEFRDTPGILMWLLGNENNYGLHWASSEIEALPEGERDETRARHLYSLYGAIIDAIKEVDQNRPVAIANGDAQYIDILAEEAPRLDIFGSNVYRGISARDLFQVVKDQLGVPLMFTEFGADAWNAREMREDQVTQARYLLGQWQEIFEQSAGKGRVGNAIGGFTFQWSDGWWKYLQEERLDIHDTNASWPNGGYEEDFVEGENNMNEEWWGITAKGPPDHRGLYDLFPRAAYYALKDAYELDAYAPGTTLNSIRRHFDEIEPVVAALQARGDRASLQGGSTERVRLKGLRAEFETFKTGGDRISTPASGSQATWPKFQGFDHMESFYADMEASPTQNVTGSVSVNVLGNVPDNPIDEIFYENRGRTRTVPADGASLEVADIERVKIYRADLSWDDRWFSLHGFYRTGHYHWGYEGDFFGLYREANYGENIDIYNGAAPSGMEFTGKKGLAGLKLAFGPALWWGANPAVLAKYQRPVGPFTVTGIFHEDLAAAPSGAASSVAVPLPPTRKFTVQLATQRGNMGIELGGIWSGSTKVGEGYQLLQGAGTDLGVFQDEISDADAFGAKARVTWESGRWHWYAQGAYMGLVADGGPTGTITYTGWNLKDSGSGNQVNALTGLAVNFGNIQIGPNFLWQKPLEGPIPADVPAPGRPRNVLDDPFAVRANRETVGAELILSYDPTPATWMWQWDNDIREDARFAASLGLVFRHLPTTQDASIGILADGRTTFPFPGATPARDLWEVKARVVSRLAPDLRIVGHAFGGTGEPNGDDQRLVHRYGADARIAWGSLALMTMVKVNDWGPYDYHKDFNLTFPLQLMGDLSFSLGTPKWFEFPGTRFGIRGTWRTLDQYSPRYCPAEVPDAGGSLQCSPTAPGADGREWEIRTYLHFAM